MKTFLRIISLFLFTALLFPACSGDGEATPVNQERNTRPNDPWVFRSVLDLNPRMVTFALNDNLV